MQLEKSLELIDIFPEFRDLPLDTKQWLLDSSTLACFEVGDAVFKRGDSIDEMRLILKGKFQVRFQQKDGWRDMGSFTEGTITGLLPYSRLQSATGSAIATQPSAVLNLHKEHFPELIRNHQELTEVLVHNMTSRVREFTKSQQQNEKLMALGKLSAGLAHELNNPASAIVRSSQLLKKHLATVPDKFKAVMEIEASKREVDLVNDLIFTKIQEEPRSLSLMEKTEMEDEIVDFLEEKGYEEAFENAELFVEYGFELSDFEKLADELDEKDYPSVIGWVGQVLATEKMVDEIEKASSRISDLVKSIKSYTHMDRSQEKELVDAAKGIEDTLNILNHKIKRKGIQKEINTEPDLPKIKVLPSELNQVWMNLLDNAIDAMEENEGKLKIDIKKENEFLRVDITDNGSGIEDDILSKIFDPFFTTKKVGEGTGLGLDVTKRVIDNHKGSIKVKSKKGETTFEVCIPYDET